MPDMRFAPPNPLRIADRASGLNAVSVRGYNERLVLSLLLQNKDITRLQIGEQTGLSAQTVSVIIRSLEQEGLIAKGEAQRVTIHRDACAGGIARIQRGHTVHRGGGEGQDGIDERFQAGELAAHDCAR